MIRRDPDLHFFLFVRTFKQQHTQQMFTLKWIALRIILFQDIKYFTQPLNFPVMRINSKSFCWHKSVKRRLPSSPYGLRRDKCGFVPPFFCKKNGGERVSCCNLLNKLKNRIVLLQQPQVLHIMALPPYKSVFLFLGIFRGFSFFYGEEMGMFLNANQPSSEPGVKPISLIIRRHKNIACF